MPMYETRDLKEAWAWVMSADTLSLPFTLSWPVDGKYMVYVKEDEKVEKETATAVGEDYEPTLEDRQIGFH